MTSLTRHPRFRRGFTLVELLVVIVVISIMASLALGGLWRATTVAKTRHTQALIRKLHDRVMARWQELRDRRLPIDGFAAYGNVNSVVAPPYARIANWGVNPSQWGRLLAKRELMRLELPQNWMEVTTQPAVLSPFAAPPANQYTTSIRESYLTAYNNNIDPTTGALAPPTITNESAECLYLIVMRGQDDNPSLVEQFSRDNIGDADQDGAPEFLDAWGNPIRFLRWAPGFVIDPITGGRISDLQNGLDWFDPQTPPNNYDGLDPMRLDVSDASVFPSPGWGYSLTPLIYSSGPDKVPDILHVSKAPPGTVVDALDMADPYHVSLTGSQSGLPMTPLTVVPGEFGYSDNIHNHALGSRDN